VTGRRILLGGGILLVLAMVIALAFSVDIVFGRGVTPPCRFQSQKHPALLFSALLTEETPEVELVLV
jgi:hypothetical protein